MGGLVFLDYPTVYFLIFSRRGGTFTKIYKIYPWDMCVFFAEFAEMTSPFWNCASVSQNSQKWHPLSENVRLFRRIRRNKHFSPKLSDFRKKRFAENLQILPFGNVRRFRIIRKNDTPFWNRASFSHNSKKWHPLSENVRLFRIMHRNKHFS